MCYCVHVVGLYVLVFVHKFYGVGVNVPCTLTASVLSTQPFCHGSIEQLSQTTKRKKVKCCKEKK